MAGNGARARFTFESFTPRDLTQPHVTSREAAAVWRLLHQHNVPDPDLICEALGIPTEESRVLS